MPQYSVAKVFSFAEIAMILNLSVSSYGPAFANGVFHFLVFTLISSGFVMLLLLSVPLV